MRRRKHVSLIVVAISILVTCVAGIGAQSSVIQSTRDQRIRGTVRIEPLNDRHLRVRVENGDSAIIDAAGFVLTWTDRGVVQIVANRDVTISRSKGDIRLDTLEMEIGPNGFLRASGMVRSQKQ